MKTIDQYILTVKAGKSRVYAVAGVNLGPISCLSSATDAFKKAGFDTSKCDTRWGDVVTSQKNYAGEIPAYKTITA